MDHLRFPAGHPFLNTPALWHPDPQVPRQGFCVVHFRRDFDLASPRSGGVLWVSACMRFILQVDGRLLARGPARSDHQRWLAERVELPDLAAGHHVLGVTVIHFGSFAGAGQLGGPAFLLVAADPDSADLQPLVATGAGWHCLAEAGITPTYDHTFGRRPNAPWGCTEIWDGDRITWDWATGAQDRPDWRAAMQVCDRLENPWGNLNVRHDVRPSPIPPMLEEHARFTRVTEASDGRMDQVTAWLQEDRTLTIAPRQEVRLVLDRGELTNAYPELRCSGGRSSTVRLVWAEAPYLPGPGHRKGDRAVTQGCEIRGFADTLRPDGGTARRWMPLHFRSFRYLELIIRTADEPLRLEALACWTTGFPLKVKARFAVEPGQTPLWDRLQEVSWRTIRCCAHETFYDCPHYEQAQFPGDSRIQAIFHYLQADEDRLARKALDDFFASRTPDGLTQCFYPSRTNQIISTYALQWVAMLDDFRIYRGDPAFLRPYLPFARECLEWFLRRQRPDGLLGLIGYAPFIDWAFPCGNAPQDADGGSAILSLLVATACRQMAALERATGGIPASHWLRIARRLTDQTLRLCFDQDRKLLADTPSRTSWSLHAQIQAVLANAWPATRARSVLQRALADTTLRGPGSHYFRFYLAQALKKTGLEHHWHTLQDCWVRSLQGSGLTTWPETDGEARSDCHAWSATPGIEAFETVLGLRPDPAAEGWGRVLFRPSLGPLAWAEGMVPTPRGPLQVRLERQAGRTSACLQAAVPILVLDTRQELPPGEHRLVVS